MYRHAKYTSLQTYTWFIKNKTFFHHLKQNIVVPQLKFDYIILNKDIKLFEISYEHFVDFIITWTHSIKLNKLLLYIGYTCFLLLFSTPLWRLRRILFNLIMSYKCLYYFYFSCDSNVWLSLSIILAYNRILPSWQFF